MVTIPPLSLCLMWLMGSFAQEFLGCIRKLRVFVTASPTLLGNCLLSLLGDGGGAGGR